jgi:hypothetical protein
MAQPEGVDPNNNWLKSMRDQVSPEDLMRYLDEELPADVWGRIDRHVMSCRTQKKEIDSFRALGSALRDRLISPEISRHSIWELVRAKL